MRRWLTDLLRVRDSDEAIARGLAVGFFFGVSLFWGLQIALAVLTSHLLRGNKALAAAMTAISNPLTTLPLYTLCYGVGYLLVGGPGQTPDLAALGTLDGLMAIGPKLLGTMLVGTTIVGLVGGLAVYLGAARMLGALRRALQRRAGTRCDGCVSCRGKTVGVGSSR